MESDRAEQQKEKKAKTENIKNENALPKMTEKTVAAEVTHSGSEPDISLVFRDDEDKRYDIDDILADIEKGIIDGQKSRKKSKNERENT